MARPERFELPTSWFVAMHSIQLSYGRVLWKARDSTTQVFCFIRDKWRRGRDSNPRWSYKPHTPLAGERLQPLGHLSSSFNYRSGLLIFAA